MNEQPANNRWESHFVYPKGAIVEYGGVEYEALHDILVTDVTAPPNAPSLYVRKKVDIEAGEWDVHAGYDVDERVVWEGREYVCVESVAPQEWDHSRTPNLNPAASQCWRFSCVATIPNYSAHDVGDNKDTIQMNLPDRAQQHGDWIANSRVYDDLCNILLGKIKMQEIPGDVIGLHIEEASARSAVSMIAMKLARIATGNIQEPDHWLDIAGYARLHYDLLMKGKDNDKQ